MSEDKRVVALQLALHGSETHTIDEVISRARHFYNFLIASGTEEKLRSAINEVNGKAAEGVLKSNGIS